MSKSIMHVRVRSGNTKFLESKSWYLEDFRGSGCQKLNWKHFFEVYKQQKIVFKGPKRERMQKSFNDTDNFYLRIKLTNSARVKHSRKKNVQKINLNDMT